MQKKCAPGGFPSWMGRRAAAYAVGGLAVVVGAGGFLAPAGAQVPEAVGTATAPVAPVTNEVAKTVDQTIDTGQATVDRAAGAVGEPVKGVVDKVQGVVDDAQGTVGKVVRDPVSVLPDLPDLPELPALPRLPDLPDLSLDRQPAKATAGGSAGAPSGRSGSGSGERATAPQRDSSHRLNAGAPGRTSARRGGGGGGSGADLMSTADIVATLEEVQAPARAVRQVLAPFPVAGLAEYLDDGRATAAVGIEVLEAAPVVAVAEATVTSVTRDESGELQMALATDDGTTYVYAGVDRIADTPSVGETVHRAERLGTADGTLAFSVLPVAHTPDTLAYLGDALGHARAKAGLYAAAMRVAGALFGMEMDAAPAASVTPAAVPRELALGASALLILVSLGLGWAAPASAPDARRRVALAVPVRSPRAVRA